MRALRLRPFPATAAFPRRWSWKVSRDTGFAGPLVTGAGLVLHGPTFAEPDTDTLGDARAQPVRTRENQETVTHNLVQVLLT
jgi:hypothetical protein